MSEREFRGTKYTGYRRATEIAKDFRADVKEAKKSGELPNDLKLSVRCDSYSGGQSINVEIVDFGMSGFQPLSPERTWQEAAGLDICEWNREAYKPEAQAIIDLLEGMLQAYNRDRSDSQTDYFDVCFYGHVKVDWELTNAAKESALMEWVG